MFRVEVVAVVEKSSLETVLKFMHGLTDADETGGARGPLQLRGDINIATPRVQR
jgi:hypothetical protein